MFATFDGFNGEIRQTLRFISFIPYFKVDVNFNSTVPAPNPVTSGA